jgi:hypothetical protein
MYTLLVDNVVLEGVAYVLDGHVPVEEPLGARTAFDLILDEQYQCLLKAVPGNGFLHCTMTVPPAGQSNRPDPGTIPPMPAGTTLSVQNRPDNPSLLLGDHIRISGRLWLVHALDLRPVVEGNLQRSQTMLVLQPFEWNKIQVIDVSPQRAAVGSLALVAPLFQERYLEGEPNVTQRVDGHVYVAADGSNYVNSLTTSLTLQVPKLPPGFKPDPHLLAWHETIIANTTGQPVSDVRSVQVTVSGIEVKATVRAQPTLTAGNLQIADPNNPMVFCATYSAGWEPRLSAPNQVRGDAYTNKPRPLTIPVTNKGPDDLSLTQVKIDHDSEGAFSPEFAPGTRIPAHTVTNLSVRFAPTHDGQFTANLTLESSDPVGDPISIVLQGSAGPDPKDVKDKENKDSKDSKDTPDKDNKDNKDNRDNKGNKDNKDRPDKISKDRKDRKDEDDPKGKNEVGDKRRKGEQPREVPQLANPASWPAIFLGPTQTEGQADQATGKAFIRPDERPELGGSSLNEPLARRSRTPRRAFPLVPPSGSDVGSGGSEVVQ